jgi:hypothetical protein
MKNEKEMALMNREGRQLRALWNLDAPVHRAQVMVF